MRVLLVDHDSEGLEAVARAIRGVLELDCVTSKGDALLLLRQNTYDVLIACERCVDGSGLDLLGRTTRTAVPLKRVFAAAPERLQLLGPRLAPFKVQRTINYPIDLEELWLAIAQVTSGPNDETDGTIERVVLDERGIPSTGTTPRAPIPPRPPAPLAAVPPPPPAAPAVSTSASGRYATARVAQPTPEPPLRPPPRPRAPPPPQARAPAPPPPARTSDTGRMRAPPQVRAPAPALKPIPPMPMPAPPAANGAAATRDFPSWIPETSADDDFSTIAEQAKFGVQQKALDDATRRRRSRLLLASVVAIAVAGLIVFLIEKFYDPQARARQVAIEREVERMAEQTKTNDDLTRIEIDIEESIMNNDLDAARARLATLVERSPEHPRREFLQDAINRAEELSKLAPQENAVQAGTANSAPVASAPRPVDSRPEARSRPAERAPERRSVEAARPPPTQSTASQRTFGAPIGEQPRERQIPLNAPINSAPTTTRSNDSSFRGRTPEASDSAGSFGSAATAPSPPIVAPTSSAPTSSAPAAGSATAIPSAPAAVQKAAPPPVDVTPAKLVRRVAPIAPAGVSAKVGGHVLLRYTIGENGRVSDLEVVESMPAGAFDSAAMAAVRKWVYEPRKENGVAVESKAQAKLVFEAID